MFGLVKLLFSIYIFELELSSLFALVMIGFEDFLYKGNVRVLGEMLSKFFKTHVFVFVITCPLHIQIE